MITLSCSELNPHYYYLTSRQDIYNEFHRFAVKKSELLKDRNIPIYYYTARKISKINGVKIIHSLDSYKRLLLASSSPIILFIEDIKIAEAGYFNSYLHIYKLISRKTFITETLKQLFITGENIDDSEDMFSPTGYI